MKRLFSYIFFSVITSLSAFGQSSDAYFPEWEATPQMHPLPPKFNNEHAVVVMQSMTLNYIYEAYDLSMYRTIHRIVKVLDRTGIEAFNTVEIPLGTLIDSVKARTILPDGTVKNIGYEMMKVTRDGEGRVKLIFAMEAVEKNAEIEVLIRDMADPSFFGSYQMQYPIPVLHSFFEMNYPKNLSFQVKGYHGCPTVKEELYGGKKHIKIYQADIPTLEPEKYSNYELYCMRVDYRMDHFLNRNNQKTQEFGWNKYAQRMFKTYYSLTEKEKKATSRFLTSIGVKGTESELVKIKKIEEGIKTTILKSPIMGNEMGSNLDTVLDRRAASSEGILKLFAACYTFTGVRHEIGFTSDRTEHMVDVKFPNWDVLEIPLLYFPEFKSYLSPLSVHLLYPAIPYTTLGNKGVFCATNPSNGYNFGTREEVSEATIRKITIPDAADNKIAHTSNITFTPNMEAIADEVYTYQGYAAKDLKVTLAETTNEHLPDVLQAYIKLAKRKTDIVSHTITNGKLGNHKPVEIKARVMAPQLTERAGNRIVFKIGAIIGKQVNLFDPKERALPVDFDYPHVYTHTINVTLPKGCKVLNTSALKMYEEHTDLDDGHVTAAFNATYSLKGNALTVKLTETYTRMHYPVREYQFIRKVVNAPALFEQTTLLLEGGRSKTTHKAKSSAVAVKK